MAEYICSLFCTLDITKELLLIKYANKVKTSALAALELFKNNICLMCPDHLEAGRQYIHTTVINIFYNNEQSIQNGKIRKDEIKALKSRLTKKEIYFDIFMVCYRCTIFF